MTKKNKSCISKDNEEEVTHFFASEIFEHTTLPQMLNFVQNEAYNYAKSQITGDEMPESEKLNLVKRMIERKQKMAEQQERLEKERLEKEKLEK